MFLINPYILGGGAVSNPLWDDLLAYYTADNTPNDALGTYNGTLTNGTTYGTGIINNGFSFDGVNDYVDFGNVLDFDGSTPFSISCWANPTTGTGVKGLVSKIGASPNRLGYSFFINNRVLQFYINNTINTDSIYVYTTSTAITVGAMNHVVMTYDGSKTAAGCKLYVNNVLNTIIFTDNLTGSASNSSSFNIGAFNSSEFFMGGIIDETAIFSKELTTSEITELYNSGSGLQY